MKLCKSLLLILSISTISVAAKSTKNKRGQLEVICGSMFCGKSEELIRRLRRGQLAKKNVLVFKHVFDDRKSLDHLTSHNGTKFPTLVTKDPKDILKEVKTNTHIVGIDEVQFFSDEIITVIQELISRGKRVIVAGLDLDFRGAPFSCMPKLMAIADEIAKPKAVCTTCGCDAHFSQRLIGGKPAKYNDPVIMVGAEECYQPRCRNCYRITHNAVKA